MTTDLHDIRGRLEEMIGPAFAELSDESVGTAGFVMLRMDHHLANVRGILQEWMSYGGNQEVRHATERFLNSSELPHLIEDGSIADEVERLREHVRSLHRLNGWSKQKGWWCSCGAWKADLPWERDVLPRPWDLRDQAQAMHAEHVGDTLRGVS